MLINFSDISLVKKDVTKSNHPMVKEI